MPKVYILIVNYKNWEDVQECLDSLFQQLYKNFVVIVVDNNSQNNSLEHLMDWAVGNISLNERPETPIKYEFYYSRDISGNTDFSTSLIFIQNETNTGFANGNNVVLKRLLKEDAYIWLLNPDMVVSQETLNELVKFSNDHPFNSITGCVIKSYTDPDTVLLYGGAKINFNTATVSMIKKEKKIGSIDYVCGGSLFSHTKHFKDIGLLPEDYFLFWEETDWCYMAKRKGYNMQVCLTAVCYDKISTTIGKGFIADYYYTRNGLLFLQKYKKDKIGIALVFVTLRFLKRIFTGKWDNANGLFKGVLSFFKIRDRYESE
jgi:GT2 family glycosyltransferase